MRSMLAAIAAALLVATPRVAAACAVCLGGTGGGTSRAFALGTLLLSVMPLVMFGGIVLYLRRRMKAIEREASETRALRAADRAVRSHG
jgi:hypothetical protein